jgi:hypothetical protein
MSKSILERPEGFPYILFVQESPTPAFFLELTEDIAKQKLSNKFPIKPVMWGDLKTDFNHRDIRNFLKVFGNEWICREGKLFFRERH